MYRDAVEPICIWDFDKDFEKLYDVIVGEFNKISHSMKLLKYTGEKADYDEFLKNNQESIIIYKTNIQMFFRDTLNKVIKSRVQRNLTRLEDLFR